MARLLHYPQYASLLPRLPDCFKKQWLALQRVKTPDYLCRSPSLLTKSRFSPYFSPASFYDVPPKIVHPPEADRCLWNGDGIVCGYIKKNDKSQIYPKFWSPKLYQNIFFSDILNKWMTIIVSESALKEIERLGSLDVYILSTPNEKLGSRLGSHLKRNMLLKLCDCSASSDNEAKELASKYSMFIVPREEAEWTGLTLEEALKKQMRLEYEAQRQQVRPLKYVILHQILNELDSEKDCSSSETPSSQGKPHKRLIQRILTGEK